MKNISYRFVLAALAAVLTLTACGNKDDKKVATQIAAKVGSEEISVHQINQVLNRSNATATTAQDAKTLSRNVLENLIDQQLAVEQATDKKLHRSPEVVAQIEAARREILARAYIQSIVGATPKPAAEEMQKYYADHPELFAQRRVFNVQEIVVPAAAGVTTQLRDFVASARSLEDAAAWLKSKDIRFGSDTLTRAAEQIPPELLEKLQPLKDGQSMLVETAQGATLLRLAASRAAPVAEAAALPRIEQFLTNQRANEAVAAKFKELRTGAKITYMGEFAQSGAAPAAAPAAAASASMAVTEKGLAGLK